jgi:hypothetical protein
VKVGDLVRVHDEGHRKVNVIVEVIKRRNSVGTHDAWVKVLGCGRRPFHYLNVEMVSESR